MPWIGSAISAGGSILGGIMGSDAAGDAAKAQQEAVQQAMQIQARQQSQARADNSPFLSTGQAASRRLAMLLGLNGNAGEKGLTFADAAKKRLEPVLQEYAGWDPYGNDFENARTAAYDAAKADVENQTDSTDPMYGSLTRKFTQADLEADPVYQNGLKFGLDQGTGAINARAIQNGGYDSGATLKALTRFGNDYGSTKAGESYGRFTQDNNNIYSKLAGTAGMGLSAAGANQNAGMNFANQSSSLAGDMGNAQAAGRVGQANAMAGAFGGIGTAIQGYQNNDILQKLLKNRGGTGTGYGGTIYGAGGSFNPDN